MLNGKVIFFGEECFPFIFQESKKHSVVAQLAGSVFKREPVGAGFCNAAADKFHFFGTSESLGLMVEKDNAQKATQHFKEFGIRYIMTPDRRFVCVVPGNVLVADVMHAFNLSSAVSGTVEIKDSEYLAGDESVTRVLNFNFGGV